jgi:hypothetical protein
MAALSTTRYFALLLGLSSIAFSADPATVYVYRLHAYDWGKRKITLVLDGKELARLQDGRYFVMRVDPGEHVLSDKKAAFNITLALESGKSYFVRAEFKSTVAFMQAKFSMTDPAFGAEEIKAMRLLDFDQVENHQIVTKP